MLARARLAIARSGFVESKLLVMACNTSGWIPVASRNVTPINNSQHKWVHLSPEITGFLETKLCLGAPPSACLAFFLYSKAAIVVLKFYANFLVKKDHFYKL